MPDRPDPSVLARLVAGAPEGSGAVVIVGEAYPDGGAGIDGLARWMEPAAVRRELAQAADRGVSHVVLVSSAMAYGAWPNNPVPLTEEAPLRPEPANALAVGCGEVERLVGLWRSEGAGRTATVLRPGLVVHEQQGTWLARSPWGGRGPAVIDPEPPLQYLHLDDLVSAVAIAAESQFDGVLNVAPDGWLVADQVRALAGPAPRVSLPGPLAQRAQRLRWDGAPLVSFDGVLPYMRHPWVVANDALTALGWEAKSTNEEAFVAASPAGPLTGMSPKRRQVVALGGAVVGIAGVATAAALILRRAHRAS